MTFIYTFLDIAAILKWTMTDLYLKKETLDFINVAHEKSFSKAADRSRVMQSGLSKSIKKLEIELGHKLFVRSARSLRLTSYGEIYLKHALSVRDTSLKALQEFDKNSKELSGKFKLQCHPVIANTFLPKLLKELSSTGIDIEVELSTSRKAVEAVRDGVVDVAVAIDPIPFPDLVIKKLWSEYLGLYSKSGLKQKEILYNHQTVEIVWMLGQVKATPKKINNYNLIYSLLKQSSKFMGILPNTIVEDEKKIKLITKLKTSNCFVVYRADMPKNNAFKHIINLIKQTKNKT